MMNLYEALKGAPKHSQRLMQYLKKNPHKRIYGYARDYKNKYTKAQVLSMPLEDLTLNVSYLDSDMKRGGMFRGYISGRNLGQLIHGWGEEREYHIGKKVWIVDVTDRFIEEYTKVGPCSFYGDGYHEWDQKTKKTRVCKFCGHKEVKITRVVRREEWVSASRRKS